MDTKKKKTRRRTWEKKPNIDRMVGIAGSGADPSPHHSDTPKYDLIIGITL